MDLQIYFTDNKDDGQRCQMTHPKTSPHHLILQRLEPMPLGLTVVPFVGTALMLAWIRITHNTAEALSGMLTLESSIQWV